VAAGSYRSRIEVAVKAAAVSGVHTAREAAGRGSQWLGKAGGQWHAAPVCKKQRAEATNGSGELEGGDTWHRRAGSDGQRRSAAVRVGSGSARRRHPRDAGVREAAGSGGQWLRWAGGRRQRGLAAVVAAAHAGGVHTTPTCRKQRPMARAGWRAVTARVGSGLLCVGRAADRGCDFG
jgi:hypothetical protein